MSSIQQYAVLGHEHALAGGIAFQHEIPLSGRDRWRRAAIDSDPDLGQRDREISPLVGRSFQCSPELQSREWLPAAIARLNLQAGAAAAIARDMRLDLPLSRCLIVRRGNLLLVAEARAIGAVDLGARQCRNGKL